MSKEILATPIEQDKVPRNVSIRALSAGDAKSVAESFTPLYTYWVINREYFRVRCYPSAIEALKANRNASDEVALWTIALEQMGKFKNAPVVLSSGNRD